MRDDQQFNEQVIAIDRVARVVKGGRRFRFRALVAVGDNKTKVGIGSAKASDVQGAITKAIMVAKKQLVSVPLTKQNSIPHEITVKHGGAQIMLKPAAPGTGVIAGGVVRAILDVTGIENILSKTIGSSNKTNNAYATIKAFSGLVPRDEWVTTRNAKDNKRNTAKPKAKEKKPAAKKATGAKPSAKKASK